MVLKRVRVILDTPQNVELAKMHSHENVVHDDTHSREVAESGNGHNWRYRRSKECLRAQIT